MNMSDPIGTSTRVVTCIYCEEQKPVTADHVPPTNLLDRPFPPNLLIVPACSDCNGWFSKDDEYFRISLTITDKAKGQRAWEAVSPTVLRGCAIEQASGSSQMRASRAKLRRAFGGRSIDALATPEGNMKTDTAPVTLSAYELQVLAKER